MKSIKDIYELIKEKRANAIKDMSGKGVLSVDNPCIRELKGEIDAYYDVIILIENSGLLKEIDAIEISTALEILKDLCNLKVHKNKLGQCFLEGTNILFPISQEAYDLLKKVLL